MISLSSRGSIKGLVLLGLWIGVTLAFWFVTPPLESAQTNPASSLSHVLTAANKDVPTAEEIEVKKQIELLSYWTSILEKRAPEYVWGGSDPDVVIFDTKKKAYRKGTDCSGSIFWIFRKSGYPFPRVTSNKMYMGMGWPGYNIKDWRDAMFPDLIFFTFSSDRPEGHVALVRDVNPKLPSLVFAEASSKANKFKRTILTPKSYHAEYFAGIRILDLTGKPKGPQKAPRGSS